jgi:G6PDH family F420-dependent oxidoreductase
MVELGYALSSEEHDPNRLVGYAADAEDAGFSFAVVSDHYHPWTTTQGESPFVWSVLGGIARETDSLEVGTGVTCPIRRTHPAIVAQAAATAGVMLPDRFFLGVGTGERLNEHVVGGDWPPHHVRLDMLEEAVGVIRELWQGGMHSHRGDHFTVEDARVFTLPPDDQLPPIHVAAGGKQTAEAAASFGDGLVSTSPDADLVETFADAGGGDAPRYGQVTVCWAESEAEARRTAREWWPNGALPGELGQLLPTPTHFEQAAELVTEDDVAEAMVLGPDAQDHVDRVEAFADAGFDHVYVHQVGPDQEGFLRFYESEVLPSFA